LINFTPVFGQFVLSIGAIFLFLPKRILFFAFVISVPFHEANIAYFPAVTFYLNMPMFFMVLLIARELIAVGLNVLLSYRLTISRAKEDLFLVLLLIAAVSSLVMPWWIDGQAMAHPLEVSYLEFAYQPIALRRVNFTQLAYLLFWGVGFWVLKNQMKTFTSVQKIANIIIWLGVFTVISGFLNIILYLSGYIDIAVSVYNKIGARIVHHTRITIAGLPRLYSIAGEPGQTSLFLLIAFGLSSGMILFTHFYRMGPKKSALVYTIILLAGLLMAGTTTYVGLLGLIAAIMLLGYHYRFFSISFSSMIRLTLIAGFAVSAIILVLYLVSAPSSLADFLYEAHYLKIIKQKRSIPVRWRYVVDGLDLFLQYPLLGVGIGSNRCSTLIVSLLSNLGVLGTCAFLFFILALLKKCLIPPSVLHKGHEAHAHILQMSLFISLFAFSIAALIGQGTYVLREPHFWLLCAMISALARQNRHLEKRF
jgi:hypothetical protein